MSVLVTGGAGYIGSHMVLALADAGEAVTVLDNLSTGLRTAVDSRAELVEGDIGDAELVRGIFQRKNITDVVHFAGSIVVPESVTDPLKYYSNNTAKTRNLIECCVKEAVPRFVFSSTAAVYGSPEQVPVTEDVQLAPMSSSDILMSLARTPQGVPANPPKTRPTSLRLLFRQPLVRGTI